MKKLIITLVLVFAAVVNVNAMSKYRASREARFLTDKMAWELDLSYSQMEDVYEINYDYFRSLVSVYDNYTLAYEIRNEELSFVLTPRQWTRFMAIEYFYVPVRVRSYSWYFPIHNHYSKDHFYYDAPHAYSHYSGGHANNKDFYRGRVEIHTHAHELGHKPQSSGNIGHAHGITREEMNRNNGHQGANHNVAPQGGNNNNNNVKPQGNQHNTAPQGGHNNNNNVKPQGNQQNGGQQHNSSNNRDQQHNATPSRTTPNRSNSANTRTSGSNNNGSNSTARPTRSQQSNGSKTAGAGRR